MLGKCSWLSQIQPKRNCPNLIICVWDTTNSVLQWSMSIYLPSGSRELSNAIPCPSCLKVFEPCKSKSQTPALCSHTRQKLIYLESELRASTMLCWEYSDWEILGKPEKSEVCVCRYPLSSYLELVPEPMWREVELLSHGQSLTVLAGVWQAWLGLLPRLWPSAPGSRKQSL